MADGYDDPVGNAYRNYLLEVWSEIFELNVAVRNNVLNKNQNPKLQNDYVAILTAFYAELWPKIEGRTDKSELVGEYNKYNHYTINFDKLLLDEGREDLFKMHAVLRKALEELGITKWDSGRD